MSCMKEDMNKVNTAKKSLLVLSVFSFLFFGSFLNAFADGNSGTGADGGGGASGDGCKIGHHYNSGVCPELIVGGASWHLFETTNSVSKINLYNGTGQPKYDTSITIMKGGGYDNSLATKCSHSVFKYYFAFVYDGWNKRNSDGSKKDVPTYWGPVDVDVYITIVALQAIYMPPWKLALQEKNIAKNNIGI